MAIIAAHAELFYSDILSSNSFPGLEQSGDENTFDDMFQSFDSSFPDAGDLNIDLFGSSDFGSNDPMLSADVADDQCLSFFSSSLLDGKARRRRGNDPAKCSSGGAFPSGEVPLGEVPSGEVPDLSPESVEAALATPTEFELQSCTGAGHFGALAFLVCASLTNSDARTNLMSLQFRVFTLFHSTRGKFLFFFPKFHFWMCGPCQFGFRQLTLWSSSITNYNVYATFD